MLLSLCIQIQLFVPSISSIRHSVIFMLMTFTLTHSHTKFSVYIHSLSYIKVSVDTSLSHLLMSKRNRSMTVMIVKLILADGWMHHGIVTFELNT